MRTRIRAVQMLSVAVSIGAPAFAMVPAQHGAQSLDKFTLAGQTIADLPLPLVPSALLTGGLSPLSGGPEANNTPFWIGANAGSWSTATNWSTAIVPNDATDSAAFVMLSDSTSGNSTELDAGQQVGSITFDSPFRNIIAPPTLTQNTLTLSGGTITINAGPNATAHSNPAVSHSIAVNISGTNGLIKQGPGALILIDLAGLPIVESTFTGNVQVNAGVLGFSSDLQLGDGGNSVLISNGAQLQYLGDGPTVTPRSFTLGAGGGVIDLIPIGAGGAALTISGVVTGGDLTTGRFNGQNLTLTATNSYSGVTTIKDAGGLGLDGAGGAILNSATINLGGALVLNATTAKSSRLKDTADIVSSGGTIIQTGRGSGTSETTGTLHLAHGDTTILVANSASAVRGTLTFAALDRQNRSTLNVRGKSLGAALGGNSGNLFFTAAPSGAIGGAGAAGTTTISILPYITGNSNSSSSTSLDSAGLVTYEAAVGLRPLSLSEYQSNIAAAGATENVRVSDAQTLANPTTINALVLGGSGATGGSIDGAGTLTITSGALVFADTSTDASASVINNPIDFGSAEAIITRMDVAGTGAGGGNTPNIAGRIEGTNGATFSGIDAITLSSSESTYTGQTTITRGIVSPVGSVISGSAGAFGSSTTPIIISPGNGVITSGNSVANSWFTGIAMLTPGAICSRDVIIRNDAVVSITQGTAVLGNGFGDGGGSITFSGNITLEAGTLTPFSSSTTAAPSPVDLTSTGLDFAGTISGAGRIDDLDVFAFEGFNTSNTNAPVIRLSSDNTYSGGTSITNSIWQVAGSSVVNGSGTLTSGAFGTGSIAFEGGQQTDSLGDPVAPLGAIQAFGAPRTIANAITYKVPPNFVGSEPLTLSGPQDMDGAVTTLNVESTADVTISGTISRGGIDKAGPGRLILTGSNNYTGQTVVSAGVLSVRSNVALGTSVVSSGASTFIVDSGVLEIEGGIASAETVLFSSLGTPTTPVVTGNLRSISGVNTLTGSFGIDENANIGVDAGSTLNLTGDLVDNVSSVGLLPVLSKVGDGRLNVKAINFPTGGLNVQAGAVGIIANGTTSGTSHVTTLSLAGGVTPTGTLDLNDNDLIVGSATPTATVIAQIKNARNGGAWNQPGITSSAADANAGNNTTLGVLTGLEYTGVGGTGTFSGQTYVDTDTLVKYTYYGDTDFNGVVGFDDYTRIDQGFNLGRTGWLNGDFDFSGVVGFDDYSLIDLAFNTQSGTLARAISYLSGADTSSSGMDAPSLQMIEEHLNEFGPGYAQAFLAQTPEPTSLGVMGLIASASLIRRRRRH